MSTGEAPQEGSGACRAFPEALRNRYQLQGVLGQGGMGVVYRVRDLELERDVALKWITLPPLPEVLTRMEREARVMGRIRHPGVVEVYDFGVVEGLPYLVMEVLDGKDLTGLDGTEDPLPPLLEVASALEEVHRQGLLHRDVKPANIFLTASGRTVLTDFGLAYDPDATPLTRTGMVLGTLNFMSPEALRVGGLSPAADWWAWGATLYRLVEGDPPYPLEVLFRARLGQVPLPELSFRRIRDPGRRALLRACLHLDPRQRPRDPGEITALLGQEEEKPEPMERTWREAGRGPVPRASREQPVLPSGASRIRSRASALSWAVLAGCLLLLLCGFLYPRLFPGEEPRSIREEALGPQASGEGSGLLVGDLARQVLEELEQAGWRYRGPGGEVEDLRGKEPGPGWEEVLSLDPSRWQEVLGEIPSLGRFRDWFTLGGRRGDLDPEDRAALESVDARFRSLGLPRPFFPLLYLDPTEARWEGPGEFPEGNSSGRDPTREVRGWRALALGALEEAQARSLTMREQVERVAGGDRDFPPDFPGDHIKGLGFLALRNVSHFPQEIWHQESARRSSGAWSRPLGEAIHSAFFAAHRSLRELPPREAHSWSLRFNGRLHRIAWWSHSYLARLDWRWILGDGPRSAAEWSLANTLWREQCRMAGHYSWPREELLDLSRRAHVEALRLGREEGAGEDFLIREARSRVHLEYHQGGAVELLEAYRSELPLLRKRRLKDRIRTLVPQVLWAGQLRRGEGDRLTSGEILELLAWVDSRPDLVEDSYFDLKVSPLLTWARGQVPAKENPVEPSP